MDRNASRVFLKKRSTYTITWQVRDFCKNYNTGSNNMRKGQQGKHRCLQRQRGLVEATTQ